MKYAIILPMILLAIASIPALTSFRHDVNPDTKKDMTPKTDKKGFAVLELFTSEGCSSCPPADDLMAKIQNEYKDQPVYLLGFHVDYWDRQGWKDAFSNPDYSNRQIEYGNWLSVKSIYTPELVVNGMAEYVGSDGSGIRKAITKALAMASTTDLSIQARQKNDKLALNYQVINGSRYSRLLVAVVQKSAKSQVERGENKGLLLSHVQIVRSLHSESLSGEGMGTTTVMLPKGFNTTDWEVIAMVQDLVKGGIATVTKVKI